MKIHLEFTAVLQLEGVRSGDDVEVPDGCTITDLLTQLRVRPAHQKYVVPFVNGKQQRLPFRLSDGDKVIFSLPVGGG